MESSNTDEIIIIPFVAGFSEHQCGMEKKLLLVPTHRFSAKTCSVKRKLNLANLYLNKT